MDSSVILFTSIIGETFLTFCLAFSFRLQLEPKVKKLIKSCDLTDTFPYHILISLRSQQFGPFYDKMASNFVNTVLVGQDFENDVSLVCVAPQNLNNSFSALNYLKKGEAAGLTIDIISGVFWSERIFYQVKLGLLLQYFITFNKIRLKKSKDQTSCFRSFQYYWHA